MKILGAAVLLLMFAIPSVAQTKPAASPNLSPAFREVALDAFDRLDSLPAGPFVRDSLYQMKRSETDVLLSKLRRTAVSRDEVLASEALNHLAYQIGACRIFIGDGRYDGCLKKVSEFEKEARLALGLKLANSSN